MMKIANLFRMTNISKILLLQCIESTPLTGEYWMIIEDQAFLWWYDLAIWSPPTPSPSPVSKLSLLLSLFVCHRSSLPTDGWGGGGGRGAKSSDHEKALSSIKHSILSDHKPIYVTVWRHWVKFSGFLCASGRGIRGGGGTPLFHRAQGHLSWAWPLGLYRVGPAPLKKSGKFGWDDEWFSLSSTRILNLIHHILPSGKFSQFVLKVCSGLKWAFCVGGLIPS